MTNTSAGVLPTGMVHSGACVPRSMAINWSLSCSVT
ncbi:Uncharacterised protein [Bordetella pertussis]|nr:Uncharacterised protein [Bordetella pertussis]